MIGSRLDSAMYAGLASALYAFRRDLDLKYTARNPTKRQSKSSNLYRGIATIGVGVPRISFWGIKR